MVERVFLAPLRYWPSYLSRIGFSIPISQLFMLVFLASNFANLRSRAFGLPICKNEPLARFEPTTSTSIVIRLAIGGAGVKGWGRGGRISFGYVC